MCVKFALIAVYVYTGNELTKCPFCHYNVMQSSNTVPVPIDRSSYQLHDATSAADEASQESGREATNRDATM